MHSQEGAYNQLDWADGSAYVGLGVFGHISLTFPGLRSYVKG